MQAFNNPSPNYPVALCLKAILIIMKVCMQHACIVHACTATWPYMYILMYIVIDINNRKSCYYATMYFSFIYLRHYFSQVTITHITTPVHELNDFFFLQVTQDHSKMISYFFLIITPKLLYKKPMSNVGKNLLKFEQGNLLYSIPICHLMIDKHSASRIISDAKIMLGLCTQNVYKKKKKYLYTYP